MYIPGLPSQAMVEPVLKPTDMVDYWEYVWSTPGPRSDGHTRLALVPRISYYSTFFGVASFSGKKYYDCLIIDN